MDEEKEIDLNDGAPIDEDISSTFEISTGMILGDDDDFKNLPGNAAKVYLVIMAYTAYKEDPTPDMEDLIEITGLSEQEVEESIAMLVKYNFLEKEEDTDPS